MTTAQDIQPGRQYMIRRDRHSRRVRVEVEMVTDYGTFVFVTGRTVRQDQQRGGTIIGNRRSWSCDPHGIEEADQI